MPTERKVEELLPWIQERYDNCMRIAQQKSGDDKAGWLEDAAYFKAIAIQLRETRRDTLLEAAGIVRFARDLNDAAAELERRVKATREGL